MRMLYSGLSVIALLGCGGATSEAPSTPAAEVTEAETPAAETEPAAPRSRAPEALPAERLGTVSEGDGLEVGVAAPDAQVETIEGTATTLSAVRGATPTMLIFYRGGWCPFCNFQVHELSEAYPRFRERGVQLVLVSVDRPEEGSRTSSAYSIPFPVLSDSDLDAHRAYDVLHVVDAETLARYDEMGLDLASASGRDHHTVAVPSVFVIGADGTLLFQHVDRDYRTRPSADQLLGVLDTLGFTAP